MPIAPIVVVWESWALRFHCSSIERRVPAGPFSGESYGFQNFLCIACVLCEGILQCSVLQEHGNFDPFLSVENLIHASSTLRASCVKGYVGKFPGMGSTLFSGNLFFLLVFIRDEISTAGGFTHRKWLSWNESFNFFEQPHGSLPGPSAIFKILLLPQCGKCRS